MCSYFGGGGGEGWRDGVGLLFIKTAVFQQTAFIRFHHRHRNESITCVLLLKLKNFCHKNPAGHNVLSDITIEEEGETFHFIYSPINYLFLCYRIKRGFRSNKCVDIKCTAVEKSFLLCCSVYASACRSSSKTF